MTVLLQPYITADVYSPELLMRSQGPVLKVLLCHALTMQLLSHISATHPTIVRSSRMHGHASNSHLMQ